MTAPVHAPKRANPHAPRHPREDAAREGALPTRLVIVVLTLLGALALAPLWAPLVLAAWTANLAAPLQQRLARRFRGRERAAAVVTSLVVLLILVPLVLLGVSLAAAAIDAQTKLRESKQTSEALRAFLPAGGGLSLENLNPQRIMDFMRRHGEGAASTLKVTFGALTAAAIGVVVYVYATHECLVSGPRGYAWLKRRAFIAPPALDRLADAFMETGRGLTIAIGGTALLQGAVATIGYAVVGVPSPLILGFVTTAAAFIPSVGTAIVWIPTTIFLLATDRIAAGIVLGLFGCVTSIADNFVRPWLSRFGQLKLPTFVTFVAMLGGLAAFGGFGLVLGPLFVRLAVEVLDLWREHEKLA